jgi:hypothetical protein
MKQTIPIKPFNDLMLVKLESSQWLTSKVETDHDDPLAGSATVVAIPNFDDILYFGSFNWAFDNSMLNEKTAHQIHAKMTALLNKKVYFEKLSDRGLTIQDGDDTYALIKLAKIIAYTE